MRTSHFRNMPNIPNAQAISIARWPPRWWGNRRRFITLAPSIGLLNRTKAGLPWPDYVTEYNRDVLAKLDPTKVISDLGNDAVLLCWETPGDQCHRRLVAAWLEKALNIKVPEL